MSHFHDRAATAQRQEQQIGTQQHQPVSRREREHAAWIDQHRAVFGEADTNAAIRAGIDGQPTFYARENGQAIGTPQPTEKNATAAHRCKACAHYARPGMSAGYCAARHDLPLAYGPAHPLRKLPADAGAGCTTYKDM